MKLHLKRATALASALACGAVAATLLSPIASYAAAQLVAVPTDLGPAAAGDSKDISLSLKLVDRAGLERFVASTVDRGSPNFHSFITPEQFASRYGQPAAAVARVRSFLESHGLTITKVFGNNLVISAKGTNAQLASLFGVSIHSFAANGESYQGPVGKASIPGELQDVVEAVVGLETRALYRPHHRSLAADAVSVKRRSRPAAGSPPTAGVPGQYTVGDLAKQYNITPLYNRGLNGAGTTLGIMTFAAFDSADIAAYWSGVGLSGDTSRISVVTIPGGKIATDADGEGETSIDIEQSGGVAQGAKVIVYEAPNNANGSLALYTTAVTENKADTLSISWGGAEGDDTPASVAPFDAVFLQAASQGTPIIASAGDSGAYDLNSTQFPYPYYSLVLSVDFPASSPYVLAAGGTTLPGTYALNSGDVTVPAVRPWAWDYLYDYEVANNGEAFYYANDYPVGGGGGVSVVYPLPTFQQGLAGMVSSAPGQTLYCFTSPPRKTHGQACKPGTDELDLPIGIAGRNVPDVSLDADPISGYSLFAGGAWGTDEGGTSFVAPQLNGIFSLITQQNGKRVGWLQPQLYATFKAKGYASGSPFRAVSTGDNEFWTAAPNYNPASGLGELDVDNLSKSLAP